MQNRYCIKYYEACRQASEVKGLASTFKHMYE